MYDCSSFPSPITSTSARAGRPHPNCAPRRIAAALAIVGFPILATWPAHAQRLVVVSSSDAQPYRQALAGIRKIAGLTVDAQELDDSPDAPPTSLPRLGRDTAVVALGTRASELVAHAAPSAPLVSCMVLSSDAARGAANVQVVPIEVPIETQIDGLRTFLPEARSIGILFDPALNAKRTEVVAAALAAAGYAPVLAPVTSHAMLPQALSSLPNSVDAILAIPDTTVYTQQASKALLLFSFRNKIPLIGLTEAWVKAGALYALEWDYEELGTYCGALGLRALQAPKSPPPPLPRPRIAINLRSAEQLGIKWNAGLLHGIDTYFE